MPKSTKENEIEEKLKYIGLDLEKIPVFFTRNQNLQYHPVKTVEENNYRVYKYIPVSKIQIFLTPMNRLDNLKEKYSKAMHIASYLKPETEEDILKHTTFLKMLKSVSIEDIKEVEEKQKSLNKKNPFEVKYHGNYLWQIYYAEELDKYFMLVPTEDLEYSMFFYLLKKQIEYVNTKKETMIFVPITQEEYSGEYLKKSEITDLEKYIWTLTNYWPSIYEVSNKKEEKTIQIIGNTKVYEQIQSMYKVILESKEESQKFYQLSKALFILQTTLPQHYKFKTKINKKLELEFYYKDQKIDYSGLTKLLKEEYKKAIVEINTKVQEEKKLKKQLESLKQQSIKKDQEYFQKEREIATYLECRKTFLGKVKYFFRTKKRKKQQIESDTARDQVKEPLIQREEKDDYQFIEKEYYTIEDIISIYQRLDNILSKVTNLRLDIKALKNKIENIEYKIQNAALYIEEIDKHEKSIFEFWKFANKDEKLMLNESQVKQVESKLDVEKVFDYENDLGDIFILLDKEQRKKQTKQEMEDIFVMTTQVLNDINSIENETELQKSLDSLKEEIAKTRKYEELDFFGNVSEVKIQMLAGKKHRETKKDLFHILDITSYTTIEEYKEKLKQIKQRVENLLNKSLSPISIHVYKASNEALEENLQTFEILPEKELSEFKDEKEINLYRVELKEYKSLVIYFTNAIFYYNENQTLPLGMNIQTRCLLDTTDYIPLKKEEFFVSNIIDEFHVTATKVKLYQLEKKEEKHD